MSDRPEWHQIATRLVSASFLFIPFGRDTHRSECAGDFYNVLSIDGVGFRSMSSMYILEHVLRGARSPNSDPKDQEEGEEEEDMMDSCRPCEQFDLICGSSAGALLAILLGCLRMTCMEAREAYEVLGQTMYEDGKPPLMSTASIPDRSRFIEQVENIIHKAAGTTDLDMRSTLKAEQGKMACRVSV